MMVPGKHVERAETEALKEEANRLLAKGDHRRALALNEAVTSIDRSDCGSWLDAAQSAMELRLGLRTLELLKEAEPLCGGTELERWVNLESEALRRFGTSEEGLAFVMEWIDKVNPELTSKLLLRKAAFHIALKDIETAAECVRRAWSVGPRNESTWLVSVSNVALLTGEARIAAEAGGRLLKLQKSIGGLVVSLFGQFLAMPLPVRIPIALLLVALLLIPGLRPAYLVLLAVLVLAALVTRRAGLVSASYSLAWFVLGLSAAYALIAVASVRDVGTFLGILAVALVALGLLLLLRKARRSKGAAG